MDDLQQDKTPVIIRDSVVPIDYIRLPPELDGSAGTNRGTGHRQITADDDVAAIRAWLASYVEQKSVFDSYRKEAERFLLWSTLQLGKPLSSLTHEDFLVYKHFLGDPQPRDRWVDPNKRKHARSSPEWRPFAGPLSESSQRQAATILNSMFSWLVQAGYLAGSPLALSKRRKKRSGAPGHVARVLDDDLWIEVKATVDAFPQETDRQREHYSRQRWLITLIYVTGARISEVIMNNMGGFMRRRDKDGVQRWWLRLLGKGDKVRFVPATDELMEELARYRRQVGLPPAPITGELTPLVLPIGGKSRQLSRGGLHKIVKSIFAGTAKRIRRQGPAYEVLAARVEKASTHWLRHTAATDMLNNGVGLEQVRDNLGHVSIATTNTYVHSFDNSRHDATSSGHRIRWDRDGEASPDGD